MSKNFLVSIIACLTLPSILLADDSKLQKMDVPSSLLSEFQNKTRFICSNESTGVTYVVNVDDGIILRAVDLDGDDSNGTTKFRNTTRHLKVIPKSTVRAASRKHPVRKIAEYDLYMPADPGSANPKDVRVFEIDATYIDGKLAHAEGKATGFKVDDTYDYEDNLDCKQNPKIAKN